MPQRRVLPGSMRALHRRNAGALLAALLAIAAAGAAPVFAQSKYLPDALGAEYGYHDDVDVVAVTAHWKLRENIDWLAARNIEPRIQAQLSYWHSRPTDTDNPSLWTVGIKGILRWSPPASGVRPFVEAGFGVQLQSHVYIYDRDLGIALQFASRATAGFAFGESQRYEIGVFVEHDSNGRISRPNQGLSYAGILLRTTLP